jgi:AcrR family transcriptional regulator
MGLRELKKEQTRMLIADTAWRLFADRGFDQVSVAEVAREAQVAEATVYNYFPGKEDLFYWRLESFGTRLTDAVSARPAAEPVLAAFRRALLAEGGLLAQAESGDPEALARLRTVNRIVAASPALLAREQQAMSRNAGSLAALLAADTSASAGDLRPQVAANAMIGVHRALVDYLRRRVLAGDEPARLAADVRRLTTEAFELLEHGLRDYAANPPAGVPRTGRRGRRAPVGDKTSDGTREATVLAPYETEFARAWDTPGHTRYQLPDTDVNKVLAARYITGGPLTLTRGMLWDMEARKAARPGTYIPYVVQDGSDRSWNRHRGDGGEYLDRCSVQRLWLHPQRYELILERAFLNHGEQKITFLGVPELTDADGTLLRAGTGQPLFHVEHSAGGTESQPLNRWRIVHLTGAPDERLIAMFEHMAASPWLAEHTEIYIRDTLGIQLTRRHLSG